jgi:hypothetical protein
MAHLRRVACETYLHGTDSEADPIGDLCRVCGSLLEPVGELGEIVGSRVIEARGMSHAGASVAGQLIADRVGEIAARRELGSSPSRASSTLVPCEPFVACAAHASTDGRSAEGERHGLPARRLMPGARLAVTRSGWLICTTVMFAWVSRSLAWALRGLLR